MSIVREPALVCQWGPVDSLSLNDISGYGLCTRGLGNLYGVHSRKAGWRTTMPTEIHQLDRPR